jgi:hypothetical protein
MFGGVFEVFFVGAGDFEGFGHGGAPVKGLRESDSLPVKLSQACT